MRRTALTSLLVLMCFYGLNSQSQTYVFGRAAFAVGSLSLVGTGPNPVATGDFNGDGIADVVAANSNDNTVSVLLGRLDGSFAPQVTYATGPAPVGIAVGDFNGDGNLDLAVVDENCAWSNGNLECGPGTVSVLLGNGDGTFQQHIDYSVGMEPLAVVTADFNGDGKLDLAVSTEQDKAVSVLLGNGDGTFQNQVAYEVLTPAEGLVVGDFNGDGKPDIAAACGYISVLLGNGDGTFKSHVDSPTGFGGGTSLAAGDFNHDGKLDLALGGGAGVSVLFGNGDGTFVLNATYAVAEALGIAAADLNGDGKIDLVSTGGGNWEANNAVVVMLGNGDGTFQSPVYYGAGVSQGAVLADVNGDGKLDLLTLASPTVVVLLGFGDGTFVGEQIYSGSGAWPVSADFNGDGIPDLATERGGVNFGDIDVNLGNGNGTFRPHISTQFGQFPFSPIAAADFNGDGKMDVATVFQNCGNNNCLPGTAAILLGNGDGTFQTPPQQFGVGLNPMSIVTGDFNSDSHPDLAVGNSSANTISVLINNGKGTFKPHVDYTLPGSPNSIATGDFRGIGTLDLVVANGGSVSVLLGNGDGTFKPHVEYAVPNGTAWVAVGDFNGDGELDVLVTNSTSVYILFGNGDGTLQGALSTGIPSFYAMPALADFNGDGKLDLLLSQAFGNGNTIYLGNGDATFEPGLTAFLSFGFVAIQDFNNDGAPDIAGSLGGLAVTLSAAFKAIAPASLNFGSQGVGTTSTPKSITITNISNVKVNVASIVPNGSFDETDNCGPSIDAGSSCMLTVTFSPMAAGQQSGAVTVTDSTRISPLAIPLTGTGVNGPFLTISPARQNFSPQSIGSSSNPTVLTLTNTGNSPLNIAGIAISGADSSDYSQTNNCGGSLQLGGYCAVNVTFTPTAAGSRLANLAVSDNAPASPQLAILEGTGLGALPSLSPNSLTFASEPVGETSSGQPVNLVNLGSAALKLTRISISGDFTQTNDCGSSLSAGASCQITVKFTPSATGARAGSLSVADNAAGSPQIVQLSGTGTAANNFSVGTAPGTSSSQTISAGQSAKFNLMVSPSGSFTGTVNLSCSISPVVTPAATCSLSSSSVQITNGNGQPVTATIGTTAPTVMGTISETNIPTQWKRFYWTAFIFAAGWMLLRRRSRRLGLAPGLILLAMGLWVGCGGGSSASSRTGTPAGTYTATITASSGNLRNNLILSVTVQ